MVVHVARVISKYRIRRHLSRIRTKKPSLVEYYAMYLTGKKLRELTVDDIETAERELIPLVLKYYLNPELTWEEVVENLLRDLSKFYLYFCKRKKRLDVDTVDDVQRLVRGQYSVQEMLNWCKSTAPRTKCAFWALLERTRPDDIQRAIELNLLSKEEILEAYRRRERKLIPSVKEAIEEVLKPERSIHKKSRKVSKKRRKTGVFEAYLDLTGSNATSYLERLNVEHEFKVMLANIWFTSQNREGRLRRLEELIPGLANVVSYTKLWEYVRTGIDEFTLTKALSYEQIVNYLEKNRWRLGKSLGEKFERALELLEKSYT